MSEVGAVVAERRQWLVSDALLSLSALESGLAGPSPADAEAALHLMDLSSMLSGLGFKPEAQALKDMARVLAEDPVSSHQDLPVLMPLLRAMLLAIPQDDALVLERSRKALIEGLRLAPAAPAWSPAAAAATAPVVQSWPEPGRSQPVVQSSLAEPTPPPPPPPPQPEQPPLFSAGLTTGSYAAATAVPAPLPTGLSYPELLALRSQLLDTVQEAGASSDSGAELSPAALARLHSTQDSLIRVGQLPISKVYPEVLGAQACWADLNVLQLLEHLSVFSLRASRISVSVRNLTLFVNWDNVSLSQAELQHIGEQVAHLHGRLEQLESAVQLVVPTSSARARMLPYCFEGQWHALYWAQCVGQDENTSPLTLRLQCGMQSLTVQAEQVGKVLNMNLHPWPSLVPAPVSLQAVALDGSGRLHLVRQP